MSHGVVAGSFDPITNGHLWVIKEGIKLFDTLTVAIGVNPSKKSHFSLAERKEMLCKVLDLEKVKIDTFGSDYLVNYAKSIGATHILRGIRNESDYEYERGMRYINATLDQNISTCFIIPPRDLCEVSSSMVKGLVGPLGWKKVIKGYVPETVHSAILLKEMEGRFLKTGRVFSGIAERYSEPCRYYHTLQHISDCLDELDAYTSQATVPDTQLIETAIWFHDIIYDPTVSDNEEQSIELFKSFVTLQPRSNFPDIITKEFVDQVSQLIMATKTHVGNTESEKILLDIDLSILGKSPEEFKRYDDSIRREYAWVPEGIYTENRKRVMQGFYARGRIYYTDFFHSKYEKQAKENLKGLLCT